MAQKALIRELRLFEQRGRVSRQGYPEVPPRVEYCITTVGVNLAWCARSAGRVDA